MNSFPRPEFLNGAELIEQLLAANVRVEDDAKYPFGKVPPTDKGDGLIYLEINPEDESIAAEVIANHVGFVGLEENINES